MIEVRNLGEWDRTCDGCPTRASVTVTIQQRPIDVPVQFNLCPTCITGLGAGLIDPAEWLPIR